MDLDDTGNFSTDITAYWLRQDGFDLPRIGRNRDLGLAEISTASFKLDNRDGRFSPKNTGSPYYNTWHPYHRIKATVTFNSVAYELFNGIITRIQVNPDGDAQTCHVQAADMMYVMKRSDIRCPLMSGYTGPIINRLVDYAEAGELVTNPRFDDLSVLGGYTAMGGATLLRTTADPRMEGAASCRVTTPSTNDGIRYTIPTDVSGDKTSVAVYVQAEADEGNIYLQMEDNVGVITTGSNTALRFGRWLRLTVSGTYNGGSTTQYIQVRRSSSGGAANFRLGAVHAVPFNAAIARSVDEGQSWLDAFAWYRPDGREDALSAIQQVAENELGGLFYMDGATAVFEDKAHRWVSPHTVSQATFTERGIPTYMEVGADRVRDVVIDYPRFVEGQAGTILWEADRVPYIIEASGSVTFEIDYGGGWAKRVILPVSGTDYICNSQPDGGGVDETGNILLTEWQDWGSGAVVTLENQVARPVALTYLAIRGTPIRVATDRTPARATGASGPGLSATLSHSFRLNGRATSVEAWASYLAGRYDDQQASVTLDLSAPWPNASVTTTDMVQILARKVSDRITLTNTTLPFSLKMSAVDFYIESVSRRFRGDSVECTWTLAPVEASYFIIGTSTIGGAAVIAP